MDERSLPGAVQDDPDVDDDGDESQPRRHVRPVHLSIGSSASGLKIRRIGGRIRLLDRPPRETYEVANPLGRLLASGRMAVHRFQNIRFPDKFKLASLSAGCVMPVSSGIVAAALLTVA